MQAHSEENIAYCKVYCEINGMEYSQNDHFPPGEVDTCYCYVQYDGTYEKEMDLKW